MKQIIITTAIAALSFNLVAQDKDEPHYIRDKAGTHIYFSVEEAKQTTEKVEVLNLRNKELAVVPEGINQFQEKPVDRFT